MHGCALAHERRATRREILMFVEDVGRHNAVDAIAGRMWLDRLDGGDKIFYTTGRLTSEMVIKAAQMGIPFLVSRSGLTQMGYEIAQKVGITMIGRATNKHYLLFTGARALRRDDERTRAAAAAIAARCASSRRFPSRFVAHCHCESCRRAHGAAFVTWVGLSVGAGRGRRRRRRTSRRMSRRRRRAAASAARCGTKLFFESSTLGRARRTSCSPRSTSRSTARRRDTRSTTST